VKLVILAAILTLPAYLLAVWWSQRVVGEYDPYAAPDWGVRC
jgi:hypothetical protein